MSLTGSDAETCKQQCNDEYELSCANEDKPLCVTMAIHECRRGARLRGPEYKRGDHQTGRDWKRPNSSLGLLWVVSASHNFVYEPEF